MTVLRPQQNFVVGVEVIQPFDLSVLDQESIQKLQDLSLVLESETPVNVGETQGNCTTVPHCTTAQILLKGCRSCL